MNLLALYINSTGAGGLIGTILVAGLVIWLLFYVLPLPPVVRTILAVVVAVVLIMLLLPGCASMTPAQKAAYSDAASTLGNAVVSNVANAATSDLQNGQPNQAALESAAVFGLFSGVSQIIGNGDAGTIISSFSNHTMPKTAAAVTGIPVSDKNLAAIATVISTVAGAPPAK